MLWSYVFTYIGSGNVNLAERGRVVDTRVFVRERTSLTTVVSVYVKPLLAEVLLIGNIQLVLSVIPSALLPRKSCQP